MPWRKVWIASNFSSLWSPFVFKILGSWESSFIKQSVIFNIFRWISWSFISVLLIEGDTEAKTTRLTSFAWADLQFSDSVTLVNRYLSAVSERVSLKATDTTLVTSSDVGSPQFLLDWCRIQKILWRLNPSWDHLLAYLLLSLKIMRSPDETERKLPSRFHCKGCNPFHREWPYSVYHFLHHLPQNLNYQNFLGQQCSLQPTCWHYAKKSAEWLPLSTYWPTPFDILSVWAIGCP